MPTAIATKPRKSSILDLSIPLHSKQREVVGSGSDRKVVVASRRGGKTTGGIYSCLLKCMTFRDRITPLNPPTVLAAFPTLKQGRGLAWLPLLNLLRSEPWSQLVANIDKSDYRISWVQPWPDLVVRGAHDGGDHLRGLKLYYAWIDEGQDVARSVFDEVLEPALADSEGHMLVTGTPKGKLNILYDLWQSPHYEKWRFLLTDNEFIKNRKAILDAAQARLSARVFEQEFMASFVAFAGQIWPSLTEDHRIDRDYLPHCDRYVIGYDPGDLWVGLTLIGWSDKTQTYVLTDAIQLGDGVNVVTQNVVDAQLLDWTERYNVVATYEDRSRPVNIQHVRKLGRDRNRIGLRKCVGAINAISEGNALVNELFHVGDILVASDLVHFYEQAISYTRKQDREGNYLDEPRDHSAHMCDSFRYAVGTIEADRQAKRRGRNDAGERERLKQAMIELSKAVKKAS